MPARAGQIRERPIPQARRGAVVAVGRQRSLRKNVRGAETRLVTVAELDAEYARGRLRDGEQPQIQIEVGRVLKALLRLEIDAGRIPAALAQPQRMQYALAAVGLHQAQLRRRDEFQTQEVLYNSHARV